MTLRPADQTLAAAVSESVAALGLEPADSAVATLALRYAETIDARGDVGKVGPLLLRCLEQLGASPKARADLGKKAHGDEKASELDRLRSRRPG